MGRTDAEGLVRRSRDCLFPSNDAVHPIRSAVVHLPSQTGPPPALRSASFTTLSNPFSTARAILTVGSRPSSLCRFRTARRAASGSCGFHWIGFGACEYRREEVLVRASGYGVWWYDREARFLVRAGEDERSETVRSTLGTGLIGVSAIGGAAVTGEGSSLTECFEGGWIRVRVDECGPQLRRVQSRQVDSFRAVVPRDASEGSPEGAVQ